MQIDGNRKDAADLGGLQFKVLKRQERFHQMTKIVYTYTLLL